MFGGNRYNIPKDKEALFRTRLSVEADLSMDSVFHDMDASVLKEEKKHLKALKNACKSGREYEA